MGALREQMTTKSEATHRKALLYEIFHLLWRRLPADGVPHDIAEHMRLMCDILVLAFQTDTTRFCTLKLNNDHSSLRFPNLSVDYMIHHLLSHTDSADWLKVNRFFAEQVAYVAKKLDAIQEG